ncbi:unnamed protein product [Ectocarpus sp. 12 AP-2014]
MGKGKKKAGGAASGAGGVRDQKAVRAAVETIVNDAVQLQDSASDLPAPQALAALQAAAAKYREALARLPRHAEAAYNLATCLSEQADSDLNPGMREQMALLSESRSLLESIIKADTSGRGATTALAHHALGNVICAVVQVLEDQGPTAQCADGSVGCSSAAARKEDLSLACRHFEASVSITKRLQNQRGEAEEVLIHWGDALSSMMQILMDDGATAERSSGEHPPPSSLVQEALGLCSNACSKYSEALASETSSGGTDTDILRLKAGTVVNFLDWALPEALPQQAPIGGSAQYVGFPAEEILAAGDEAVQALLALDESNMDGMLAKADLCRLRARTSMLSGTSVQEEGARREESVAWFARAVAGFPQDAGVLAAAGEGLLEYGRRSMALYQEVATSSVGQSPYGSGSVPGPAAPHVEGMRMSAIARLQEAGRLLSEACSFDVSDANSPYNAACAYALAGDHGSCFRALSEYCRRLTLAAGGSSGKREAARRSLREASSDVDLEGARGAPWFVDLLRGTDAALVGSG